MKKIQVSVKGKRHWPSDGYLYRGNRILETHRSEPLEHYYFFYNDGFQNDGDRPAACLKETLSPSIEINPQGECDNELIRILNQELTRQNRSSVVDRKFNIYQYPSLQFLLMRYGDNKEVKLMIERYVETYEGK